MSGFVNEGEYQDYIVNHLTSQPILDANGNATSEMEYHEIPASEYNKPDIKDNCILVSELIAFLKDTQPQQYQKMLDVAEGDEGVFAMKLHENEKYNGSLRARKSWFVFGSRIICLGSDIESDLPVHTTLFQNALPGPVPADSTLGEIWIDRLDGVELNRLDNSGFSSDGVFKQYSENGAKASVTGVDVSSYNGDIDWQRVKDSGVDFAMIRVGGRGYGDSGALYPDEKAAEYLSQAKAAGIKVGAYFFSQATTAEEAAEEAEYSKEVIGDIALDYPLAYDWEIIPDDDARTDSVSAEQATEFAAAFCEKAKQLGYTPAIYSTSRELYYKYLSGTKKHSDGDRWPD